MEYISQMSTKILVFHTYDRNRCLSRWSEIWRSIWSNEHWSDDLRIWTIIWFDSLVYRQSSNTTIELSILKTTTAWTIRFFSISTRAISNTFSRHVQCHYCCCMYVSFSCSIDKHWVILSVFFFFLIFKCPIHVQMRHVIWFMHSSLHLHNQNWMLWQHHQVILFHPIFHVYHGVPI